MRVSRLGLGVAMAGLFIVGGAGCEPSTENTVKLDSLPASGKDGGPAPKSQKAYYEASQKPAGQNPYGQGYPGGQGSPSR